MNKIFRLIWNRATEAWVAAAEHAHARGRAAGTSTQAAAALLALALNAPALAQPAPAPTALPTAGQVVAGQASIQQQGATLTVNQGSNRAAIDWASFNVGSQAQVRFEQPSAQAVTLNRVNDVNASQIFGRISANGQVFLSNPNGVFFAPGASVDVGGLVATTHRIGLDDFMAGQVRFERNGATGSVVNEGELRSALGGYVALLAPEVRNQGLVVANLGTVALAAGEAFELRFDAGQSLAALRVDAATMRTLVDNRSAVLAPGGLVILSARALHQVQGGVIRNSGRVEAASLVDKGGRIVLEAEHIHLASGSRLDARGATGGGTVLVGGDWQGSGSLAAAATVSLAAGARVDASATQQGDGGTVVLWSDVGAADSHTRVQGEITARGGAQGGNGGRVETSGHRLDTAGARVDTRAPQGRTGQWLLDPNGYTIAASGGNTTGAQIAADLNLSNVTIQTTATALGDLGNIVINDNIAYTGAGERTLTFKAHNDIALNSGRSITSATAPLNTVLRARANTGAAPDHGSVAIQGSINTRGGGLWIGGGSGDAAWTPYAGASAITVADGEAASWTAGTGGVSITGATLQTGAGNIAIAGREVASTLAPGVSSYGVVISGSSITSTSGNINVTGSINGAFDTGAGVQLQTGGSNTVLQTGSGTLTINGSGSDNNTAGSGWRHGVRIKVDTTGHGVTLRSDSGAIDLLGTASFSDARTTDTSGLQFQADSGPIQVVSRSGAIALRGSNTQDAARDENAIRFAAQNVANNIRIGYDGSNAYSGNILIEGDSIQQLNVNSGAGSIAVQSTGALTIRSGGSSFRQLRAGSAATPAGELSFDDDWNFGNTLSSFTLGKATNTANISLSNALSVAGAIGLRGGEIALNANLTSTATGDISLIANTNSNTSLVSAPGVSINKTGGGHSTLTLRSNGRINLGGAIGNTSASGKLNVVLWSDYGNNNVSGVNPIQAITTKGGHVWIGGSNSAGGSQVWNGLTVGDGPSVGSSGSNANGITLNGNIDTSNGASPGGDVYLWGGTPNAGDYSINGTAGFTAINAGSGSITLRGYSFNWAGALNITNTGAFTLWSGSGTLGTDSGSFAQATNLNLFKFNATPSALTWGGSGNTQSVTFAATQNPTLTVAGPVTIHGGDIALNNDLSTTGGAAAEILVKAQGTITQAGGKDVTTQGAKVTYWADSDNNEVGGVRLNTGTSGDRTRIVTNGGAIVIGGGSDPLLDAAVNNAVGGVRIGEYSTLDAGSGDISLRGKSTYASANDGYGTHIWNQAELIGRNISVVGTGSASSGSYSGNYGVAVQGGATVNASGTLTINGTGGGANTTGPTSHGVYVHSSSLRGSAGVNITGIGGGGGGGGDNDGVILVNGSSVLADNSTLTITGTGGPGANSEGITLGGSGSTPNQLGAVGQTGNIVLRADRFHANATVTNQVLGAGTLAIEPVSASFNSTFTTSGWTFGSSLGGITLGKPGNTAAVTLAAPLSVAGPVRVHGGDIQVKGDLTTTTAGAEVLLKGSGNVRLDSAVAVQTNGGNITLWADSEGDQSGYIRLDNNNRLDSRTASARTANVEASGLATASGGGAITLGGGSGASAADGYAVSANASKLGGVNLGDQDNASSLTTIYSGGGNVLIRGKQTGSSAMGVQWMNGGDLNAGLGTVRIDGLNTGGGHGIELGAFHQGGELVVRASGGDAATPAIDILGVGAGTGRGVLAQVVRLHSLGAGGIAIKGTAGASGPRGIDARSKLDMLAGSGPITLDGGTAGIEHVGSIGALSSSPITTSSSQVTLTGDQLAFGTNAGGAAVRTTGTLTVQPFSTSFSSPLVWAPTNLVALAPTVGGLTLGKEGNTSAITLNSAVDTAGPIRIYGGNIAVNANLTSTAANAPIVLKASGNIVVARDTTLTTNLGLLTLWADSDASGQGYIAMDQGVRMNTINGATSGTGGGKLTLAGGLDTNGDGIPDGFATAASSDVTELGSAHNPGSGIYSHVPAGVSIGFYEKTAAYTNDFRFYTGGGDVLIKGQSANSTPGVVWYGGYSGATQILDAGSGTLTVNGQASGAHGMELSFFAGDVSPTLRSASNAATAISITAATTRPGSSGYQGAATLVASGSGGIRISGTAQDHGKGVNAPLGLHAASGDIILTGTVNGSGAGNGINIGGSLGKGSGLASSSSNIVLNADRIAFSSAESIDTTGRLTLQPVGTSFASALTWPVGNLSLASTLGGLSLGKAGNAADIHIDSAIATAGPIALYGGNLQLNAGLTASGSTITLQGSGSISGSSNGFVKASGLLLQGGNVALDNAANEVTTLAANGVGSLRYRNSSALSIGTVGATTGVSASGDVDIATASGNLTLNQNLSTLATTATALTLNAGASAGAGTATGGNIMIAGGASASTGMGGTARLYSGSVAGSSGLTSLVGSGSGRFRYNSDEAGDNFTRALDTGLNAIYREQPTVQIAVASASMVYGDAVPAPSLSLSGGANGDTAAQAFATLPTISVGGSSSSSGHYVAGPHSLTASGGSASSQLGYAVSAGSAGTLTVTPRVLTAGFAGVDKDYDGSTAATVTANDNRLTGDVFSVNHGSAQFADRNVGTAIVVTLTGVSLSGTDAANYSVATTGSTTASITPRTVTVAGLAAAGKVYDGNTDVTISDWGHVDTGVAGETLGLSATQARFDTATAGAGKGVTATGYALANGSGLASNYRLAGTSATTTADIERAVLTVIARDSDKFVTQADPSGFGGVRITGFVGGEDLAALGGSAGVTRSNAGVELAGQYNGVLIPVTHTLITDNYRFVTQAGNFTIVPAQQLRVRVADTQSVYGSAAPYTLSSAAYIDGNDVVHNLVLPASANADGSFTVLDGAGASVTFRLEPVAAALSGAGLTQVGNHSLVATGVGTHNSQNFSNTFTASGLLTVTPKSVTVGTVGAAPKVYDGNTAMNGVAIGIQGLLAGDAVSASGSAAYDSKHAGTGLGYSVNGITLAGNDAGNYQLSGAPSATGNDGIITPRTLELSFTGVHKVYDGNTTATVTSQDNRVDGDQFDVGRNAVFSDKNVGSGKTVSVSNLVLTGPDAQNYNVAITSGETRADITRLDSVTWIGGASGNWFDPANWAGGAVPDLANVAQVVIPAPAVVRFDPAAAVAPAQAGPVNIDSLGSSGGLVQSGGALAVGGGGITLGSFEQTGGSTTTQGGLTVNGPFAQTGPGTVAVAGNTHINNPTGGVTLGNLTTGGQLQVTAEGTIAQAGGTTVTVGGRSTLDAGNGNVVLDGPANNFVGPVDLRGNDITVVDGSGGLTLGTVTASGTLTATSTGGDITQAPGSTVTVGGRTHIDAGNGNVVLDGPGNNFVGPVDLRGSDITVVDGSGGLTLGTVTASGTLTATSTGGDITQAPGSTVTVGGRTHIDAGSGNVALDGAGNNFVGPVDLRGADITVVDGSGGLTLGTVTASGTLTATSTGGDITQAPGSSVSVGGRTQLDGGSGSVVLDGVRNDFVGAVDARGQNITLIDGNGGLTLGAVTAGGTLTARSNGGNLSQAPGASLQVQGEATLGASGGSVALTPGGNQFAGGVTVTSGGSTASGTAQALPPPMQAVSMPTPTSAPPALADAMAANSGLQVHLQPATAAHATGQLTVTVAARLLSEGFSFVLPAALTEGQAADVDISVTLADGSPLPEWLRFERDGLRLVAGAVPPNALPLKLTLNVGGKHIPVLLTAERR